MFSLRIVSTSHYQAEPLKDLDVTYSTFRSTDVRKVPILRIFGATPAGQKTCMHVHGVFPYLFVPYDGTQPADSYMRRFAASLDKAISVANKSNANTQHVFKISLVSGIPMYGYHEAEQQFLKIYMYNPNSIRKAADLLLGGAVMNKSFQPHEAHIPYPLQLFIDYNLYGMNLINVAAVKFRRPHRPSSDAKCPKPSTSRADDVSPDSSQGEGGSCSATPSFLRTQSSTSSTNTPTIARWDMDNIPSEMLLPAKIERQSVCELEVDVIAADILNRKEVSDNMGSNPGLAALWEDERQRRRDVGQISQITPQDSQEHDSVESSTSEQELLQRLEEIIQQQHSLSRSESEESEVSMEDTTLTPENFTSIPASQLENHSEPVSDHEESQGSQQSSQDTVIVSDEEERGERDEAPIISLQSIQHVVSFSQSFSQPDSQPTSTPADGEAADQSLVDILAALAEESSPTASQRSAAHVSALEDQDSIVGQGIPIPPDDAALEEDEEETLHMSQTIPHEEDSNGHHDLEGLDITWNGSSGDEKDDDCAMESDDREGDDSTDGQIPQLDGAFDDEKQAPKKSKKRLGVRGPALRVNVGEGGHERGVPAGKGTNLSTGPEAQNPTLSGSVPFQSSDHGVTSPHFRQNNMEMKTQQQRGYLGHRQWGNTSDMSQKIHGTGTESWAQSPPSQGSYPSVYHSSSNSGGYYPYAQRFCPPFRQTGAPCSPGQASFSSLHSPMSPPSYPGCGTFSPSHIGSSPLQSSSFMSSQATNAASAHRLSDSSVNNQSAHFTGSPNWQYPVHGSSSAGSAHGMSSGSTVSAPATSPHDVPSDFPHGFLASDPHGMSADFTHSLLKGPSHMSPEKWSASSFASRGQNKIQHTGGKEQYSCDQNAMGTQEHGSCQTQVSTEHSWNTDTKNTVEPSSCNLQQNSQKATSTLQALLEAPDSTKATFSHQHSAENVSPVGSPRIVEGQASALSGLYSFVSSVDSVDPPPFLTSCTTTSTLSLIPSSAPYKENENSDSKDAQRNHEEIEIQHHVSHSPSTKSLFANESSSCKMKSAPQSLSSVCIKKDTVCQDNQETNCNSSDLSSSSRSVSLMKNERLGKQSRLKKLGLSLNKIRHASENSVTSPPASHFPFSAYTFTFHVPAPVYKRFKMQSVFSDRSQEDVKVVRMHPMDARKYSLLKIGRELVCVNRLSPQDLRKANIDIPCSSADVEMTNPKKIRSSVDPLTCEDLSCLPDENLTENRTSVQLPQETDFAKQCSSRRLMGPRCKRMQTTDGSCQTSGTAFDRFEIGKMGSEQENKVKSSLSIESHEQGCQTSTVLEGTPDMSSIRPSMPTRGEGGSSLPWQTMDHDHFPTVKVSHPAQSPVSFDQKQCGMPTTDHRNDSTGTSKPQRQWGALWHGRSHPPPWNPNDGKDKSSNHPPVMGGNESKPEMVLSQRPYNSWSEFTSTTSVACMSSSASSTSVSKPVPAVLSSLSASQNSMGSSSYHQSYPHKYSYHSCQLNQQSAISPPGFQYSPGNNFISHTDMGTRRFSHPDGSPQRGLSSEHSAVACPPGDVKERSSHQDGFVSQQHQHQHLRTAHGHFLSSPQEGQYMPPNSVGNFHQRGNFSPQGQFSPLSDNNSQFSAGPHPPELSPSDHPTQFSCLATRNQFASQQNSFSSQLGQFPSPPSHSGQFLAPASPQNQVVSPSHQSGQFSRLGGFPSPSSIHGPISPCINQHSPVSPQVSHIGQYVPGARWQNQFCSSESGQYRQEQVTVGTHQQNCYSQYSCPSGFPQATDETSSITMAEVNGISGNYTSGNTDFLDTSTTGNPFLHHGACQVSTTSSNKQPSGHVPEDVQQPDRPRTKEADNIAAIDEKLEDKKGVEGLSDVTSSSDKQMVDLQVDEDSSDDFCSEQKKSRKSKEDGNRNCSFISTVSKRQTHLNNESPPVMQSIRRSSVQLWSVGDSESEDDSNESDESSDDYLPSSCLKSKGRKRKDGRLQNQSGAKQRKRSAAYCSSLPCSKYLNHDVEKKGARKARQPKGHKGKKKKGQQLIEGVHYIVVGKFKGHRNMLVKVDRIKVRPDERVRVSQWQGEKIKVSEWQRKDEGSQGKVKPRLLGPRCKRLAKGSPVSDVSLIPTVNKANIAENSENDSDASTIVEADLDTTVCIKSLSKMKAVTDMDWGVVEKANSDDTLQAQCKPQTDKLRTAEDIEIQMRGNRSLMRTSSLSSHTNIRNVYEASGELETGQWNSESCLSRENIQAIENKNSQIKCLLNEKPVENELKQKSASSPCPHRQNSDWFSDEAETSQDGTTDPPVTMEVDTDSKITASESTSQTQSPIPKPDKHSNDSPFISEHSQDADCSSLPQSNPDSASSSPAFPRMSLTTAYSHDKDSQLLDHSKSHTKFPCEEGDKDSISSSVFHFQTVCEKVKEVRVSQRVEPSSDSSDSHDCFSEVQGNREDSQQSDRFLWQGSLAEANEKCVEMDKDKLKKQRKLTTNQRLGVAFLSKRSRRRKSKIKVTGSKVENGNTANKLMDSLSLLHMATLASLGGEYSNSCHSNYTSAVFGLSKSKAEEKENHSMFPAEENFEWKTFCSSKENSDLKSSVQNADGFKDCTVFKVGYNLESNTGSEAKNNATNCQEGKVAIAVSEERPDHNPNKIPDMVMDINSSEHESTQTIHVEKLDSGSQDSSIAKKEKGCDETDTKEEKGSEATDDKTDDQLYSSAGGPVHDESKNTCEEICTLSRDDSDSKDSEDSLEKSEMRNEKTQEMTKPRLCEDSDEKTDDYTVSVPEPCSNKHARSYRKKRPRRKTKGRKIERFKTSKLLNSLDVLHMATLASLGSDQPPPDTRDTSLLRYSDFVSDHADDYEESLIKMSYTSPVHSDLGDLSPPIPLSPEELSKSNSVMMQKQRSMPCRLKLDESRGTRTVRMSQLRAENAADRSSRMLASQPYISKQKTCISQSKSDISEADNGFPGKNSYPACKDSTPAIGSAPSFSKSINLSASDAGTESVSFQKSAFTSPAVPDPDKLPTPSVPWHHPLHVVTDCVDGGAWKDRVIHDALTEKFQNRSNSLGDSVSPSMGSHQKQSRYIDDKSCYISSTPGRERDSAIPKTPPFSDVSQRENKRTAPLSFPAFTETQSGVADGRSPKILPGYTHCEKTSPASGAPLKDIHNCVNRQVLSSFSDFPRYNQRSRGSESILTTSDAHSGMVQGFVDNRDAALSQRNIPNMLDKTQEHGWKTESQMDNHRVKNKMSPCSRILQREQQFMDPKTLSYSHGRYVDGDGSNYRTPRYTSVSPRDGSRFSDKTPPVQADQNSMWLSDRSNTGSDVPYQRSRSVSDQNIPCSPQSHHSPRLSRTEVIISQMFNLDSTSASGKSPQNAVQSISVKQLNKDNDRNGWKNYQREDRDYQMGYFQYKQGDSSTNSQTSVTPDSVSVSMPNVSPDNLHLSQGSTAYVSTDRSNSNDKVSLHSHTSPVFYDAKYDHSTKSVLNTSHGTEAQQLLLQKGAQSPSTAYSDNLHSLCVKSTAAGCDKSESLANFERSQSSVGYDQPESPAAYFDNYHNFANLQRASYFGNYISGKSAAHYEKCSKPTSSMSESSSAKPMYSCMPDTYGYNSSSSFSHTQEKDLTGSRSPAASSSSSAVSSSGRSPCRGSPRGKNLETGRFSKTDVSPQQKRKRSIGEYLEEMIESAYAGVLPEESRCFQSAVAKCDSTASVTQLSCRQAEISPCLQVVSSHEVNSQKQTPSAVNASTALDLTVCCKKQDMTLADSLPATVVPCASVVSSSGLTTRSLSHPTWTSIKTDDFENITDDEEDVIPSSQEYSTSAYRFPGFRRLSSISSSWIPYSLHNPSSVSVSLESAKDVKGIANTSDPQISSHGYSNSIYHYGKGLYSQPSGISSASKFNFQTGLACVAHNTEKYDAASRTMFTQASQPATQGVVNSFDTLWHDSQVQRPTPSTTIMSQFEPITDSEEEEDGKEGSCSQSQTVFSKYCTSYPSTVYSSSAFLPAYSTTRTTSYSSLAMSSITTATSHTYPFLLQGSVTQPPLSSSGSREKNNSYSASVTAGADSSYSISFDRHVDQVRAHNVSMSSSFDVNSNADNTEVRSGNELLVCGGNGDKHSDSEPEDGGGNRKKRTGRASPGNSDSSSQPRQESNLQGKQSAMAKRQSDEKQNNDELPGGSTFVTSKHVLCPRTPPPTRGAIEASAALVGLSVEPVERAFCSHPADLPDTPRELGGRVLRLATNRVAELEEVPPLVDGRSMRVWQSHQASESRILSSQPDQSTTALALRLQREPQLRFALAGDRSCVMTPVKSPPSRSVVTAWLQDKMENIQQTKLKVAEVGLAELKDAEDSDIETSLPLDIDLPVEEFEPVGMGDSSDEENSIFTRLRDSHREAGDEKTKKTHHSDDSKDDKGDGSSTPKRQRLDSDDILHSTPVRRLPGELFDIGCTPIASDKKEQRSSAVTSKETAQQFVTPKHPPLRRLSTNTESALRHAVLKAERKQQSFEGEPSQIEGPTPRNTYGFKVTQQNLQDAKALHRHQYLTVLSMEVHADSRGDLIPDPEVDAIRVLFYAVFDDIPPEKGRRNITGAFVVDRDSCRGQSTRKTPCADTSTTRAGTSGQGKGRHLLLEKCGILEDVDLIYVESEADLLNQFIQFVSSLDPDILVGFEVQQMSWGFLLQRAAHLNVNLCAQIARIQGSKKGNRFSAERDEWGADHTSEIHIEGRIVLNLWRVLRHEVNLNIYSYENCAFHILHDRIPAYTFRSLTKWYNHQTHLHRWRVVQHYKQRVTGQLAMLDQLDIIGKTSEFARVFGIEFYDVLSRGSQYRVESMMLRLAKPMNFIPVSPSVQQRARQKAAECIPLTLEPQSRFYTDPVVVLDFQSLYPSIMIAYNYCFSTCLGRLDNLSRAHEGPFEFGCTSLSISPETLRKLRKKVTVSPNGCVFLKQKVRKGILPMMVEEILKTRLMVKKSMKDYKEDKALYRMLDARQLGLKLIANVTYGYTGASFSGRMPCIEIGDSIVRKARESLERAIQLVKDTARWQAHVVYGDTDSLFIKLPGRSKDEAFKIGQEIADTVTNMFPKPMKLKFEKVYLPCALQTKKRYVGFMYETADQKDPVFDAKGIETVRRDNCGVVSKVLERCIKILFTQRDLSQVRMYLQRQIMKMLSGRVGLHDYVFAKEYRGMMGYKPGVCVPALEIARKRLQEDRRAEPRVGERVPYVIVHGSPGLPLIQLVRQPRELLGDVSLRINVTYYITKQVLPPLDRLLGLVGVSVFQWYNDMPKVIRLSPHVAPTQNTKQGTISQYFATSDCLVCEQQTKQAVCASCLKNPQLVAVALASRSSALESVQDQLAQVCKTCMGVQDYSQPCVSLDCPIMFRRHLATLDLSRANQQREALFKLLTF